jgi:hypothetical protein
MRKKFGTVEGYFSDGLGLDESAQAELRTLFVERT